MIYPIVIAKDRYVGAYSGGKWVAFNLPSVPEEVNGSDIEAMTFWHDVKELPYAVGVGDTPNDAYQDLLRAIYEKDYKL